MQIQRISLKAFSQKELDCISTKRISLDSLVGPQVLQVTSDVDTSTQYCQDYSASVASSGNSEAAYVLPYDSHQIESNLGKRILEFQTPKNYDKLVPFKDVPYAIVNSNEVRKLNLAVGIYFFSMFLVEFFRCL